MAPKPTTHILRPAKPFDATYQLTLADNIPPAINSRYLFVYKAPKTNDWQQDLTARLSKSLASFLCEPAEGVLGLPQLAGKIYQNKNNGRLSVKVTKDSTVRFVVSHRNDITYESLQPEKGFPMRNLKGDVYAYGLENIPGPDKKGGLEAFSAQITYIHGGFVICVNKHHFLLDANSTGKFIQWWLQRARSYLPGNESEDIKLDASKYLAMHDNSSLLIEKVTGEPDKLEDWKVVPNARQHVFGFEMPPAHIMLIGKIFPCLKPKITNAVFRFSPADLAALHTEASKYGSETFSKHDAVSALLWRCITRARLFAVDSAAQPDTSLMALATNGRSRLRPKLVDEYFGNTAFYAPTTMPINVLTSTGEQSLADVAVAIRKGIAHSTTDTYMRSLLQLMAQQPKVTDVVNSFTAFQGTDLMMTSWERMFKTARDLDVGVEGTSFMNMRLPDGGAFDGMGMVLPAYGVRDVERKGIQEGKGNGYWGGLEVSVDLLVSHMENLKNDEEWTKYAKWVEV